MLRVHSSAAVALLAVLSLPTGCRKPAEEVKAEVPAADAQKPAANAPPPWSTDTIKPIPDTLPDVLARVNGESVSKADFEQYIAQMERNAGQPVPKEQRNEIYRKALDQLVTIKLLGQEVKARGVKPDDKAVDAQMQKIRSQFPSEDEYRKALASRGVTPEKLRADMLNESSINNMMNAEAASATPVTDAEIREFYEKNPQRFKQPEAVRASHILVRAAKDDEGARKKARREIEDILKQAKGGKDFGDLARKHSADGSGQRGGDLGFFTKDRMVPEFANAAFALKPGQISGIVETAYGYHVIKVIERRPESDVPIDQVTEQVRQFLAQERHQEKAEAFVKVLKSKSKIEVLI